MVLHSRTLQRKLFAANLLSSCFFAQVCKGRLGHADLFCQGEWTVHSGR